MNEIIALPMKRPHEFYKMEGARMASNISN